MTEQTPCPECGKPLPAGSAHDLCPACLMGQVMASRTLDTAAGNEPVAPPPSPEEIADKFPQFEVVECLGRGGMGVVYKARQKSLDRWVAIKVLAPERVHEERFAEHFEREAKTLARMSHPNIVTVFDHGETGGLFYIVMEYVDGVNLRDLLREAKMEPEQALAIIPPICDALEYAHDKGVVHRDIKPENILLDREGRVKIADFGIASLVGVSGEKSGTPPYMAPEQENGIVDRRADIYALGVVLYEMLTGERPNKELVAPSKKVQIDIRLDEIVLRALEKTPALRYQTAGEFRTVLETMAAPQSPLSSQAGELATRVCESLYATPEYLATVLGSMKLHEGMATLALYSDRLVIGRAWQTTTILFHALRKLNVVKYPRCLSMSGLHSILVEYEEAGIPRRIILTPRNGFGIFSSTSKTNQSVAEWFLAIREAVSLASGQPPAGSTTPEPYQGLSSEGMLWAKLSWAFTGMVGLGGIVYLILEGRKLLGNPAVFLGYFPMFVFGMAIVVFMVRMQRKQWQRDNPLPPTVGEPPDPAAKMVESETHARFSRTAIVGACWLAFIPLHFLFPLIIPPDWQHIALVELLAMLQALLFWTAPLGVTILGWIAVSEIRRSAGKLYGLWLAVFDGVLFPLLALDALILGIPFSALKLHLLDASFGIKLSLLLIPVGLGLLAFLITANVLIIRRVWRVVNIPPARAQKSPQSQTYSGSGRGNFSLVRVIAGCLIFGLLMAVREEFRDLSLRAAIAGLAAISGFLVAFLKPKASLRKPILLSAGLCIAVSFVALSTKQWNERKREGVWTPARISQTITEQYGDAQVRVVDVSQAGQVVVVSFTCEMFRSDRNLLVMYGGPVLPYPNDLIPTVKAKVTDLDCLITPKLKLGGDFTGEVLVGTNELTGRKMFRIGFILPDSETAAKVVQAVQETHLGKPRGLGEGGNVLLLFSLRRDSGKDAAGKPVVESLDATLWSGAISGTSQLRAQTVFGLQPVIELTFPLNEKGETDMLDPETGQIIPSTNHDGSRTSKAGLLIRHDSKANKTELVGMNGVIPQESRADQWAEITNFQALETLKNNYMSRGGSVGAVADGPAPHTFLFKTGNDRIGILQITRFIENPRGVEVRYKMVQPSRFIRWPGTFSLDDAGSIVITPSSDGKASLAVTMVEGTSRDTCTIPDFCKQEGWFVYVESFKRIWAFDGIRQLNLLTPGSIEAVDPSVRAGCPAAVWDAVPESVRKLYLEPKVAVQSASAETGEPFSFGAAHELTLPMNEDGLTRIFDLGEGQNATYDNGAKYTIESLTRMQAPGLAIRHDKQAHRLIFYGISGAGIELVRRPDLQGNQWEKITDREALELLQRNVMSLGGSVSMETRDILPQTCFFKTGTNLLGILQVTGFTEDGRGLKIRYKLVKNLNPAATNPASPQAPFQTLSDRPPTSRRTSLDIRISTTARSITAVSLTHKNDKTDTLVLPIVIENRSQQIITADIAREWYGGEWSPTSIGAAARRLGDPAAQWRVSEVYRVGEEGSRIETTTWQPGQSHDFQLRMNWAGTGSVKGLPLIDADRPGKYAVKLSLVFKSEAGLEYVESDKMEVTVEAAKSSGAEADAPSNSTGNTPDKETAFKPIPLEAARLLAELKGLQFSPAFAGKDITSPEVMKEFKAEVAKRTAEVAKRTAAIEQLLSGTAAEPLVKQQKELMKQIAELHKANPTGANDLIQQLQDQGKQLDAMIEAATQSKAPGNTPGKQAASTSPDPDRPLESLAAATKELVVKYFPDAQVRLDKDEFTASHATQEFQIHNKSKTGEATPDAAKETGPSFTGFILRISRKDNADISQAAVPHTFREPYWSSYINSGYNPTSKRGVWISYSFGSRLNADFHRQMLELLSLSGMGTQTLGAGTTLGVFNNTAKNRSETITIAADGTLTVAGQPCSAAQLAEKLGKLGNKEAISVVVQADEKASIQQVQAILDTCKATGINDVRLAKP